MCESADGVFDSMSSADGHRAATCVMFADVKPCIHVRIVNDRCSLICIRDSVVDSAERHISS